MFKNFLLALIAISFVSVFATSALAQDGSVCNWKVTALQAGKWGNGNKKAGLWPKGSFPIPVGTTERPTWFVNGVNCGHGQIVAGGGASMRFLPNCSQYLKDGEYNTITVKYLKPPYTGATSSKSFKMDWSRVRPGGFYTFK
jgi:hypothetical protein